MNYFDEIARLTPADVAPHLPSLFEELLKLVREGPLLAKQEALTAIAGIATIAGPAEMDKYYDYIMPVTLETCVASIPLQDEESVSLFRGKCVYCFVSFLRYVWA